MSFRNNLKIIRQHYHFSQEALANRIGVSRQSVSKWETGEAYPTMTNILAICSIARCKITDLIDLNSAESKHFAEETKQEIVSLEAKDRKRLSKISQVIYIIVKIARFLSLVSFIFIAVAIYVLRYAISNFLFSDVPRSTAVNLSFVNLIQYNVLAKILLVVAIIASLVISAVCLYRVFRATERFFKQISQGSSLFSLENVLSLKQISQNLLLWTVFDSLYNLILFCIDSSVKPSFNLFAMIFSLITVCFVYIFRYGNILETRRSLPSKN